MNPSDVGQLAQSAGFGLPSPGYLFGILLFSLAGFVAFRYGKAVGRPLTRWLGMGLMLYPYLVGSTWLLYLAGFGLCAGIWWDGRR